MLTNAIGFILFCVIFLGAYGANKRLFGHGFTLYKDRA